MRRAPIIISATVAGLAGVLGFEPRAPTVAVATSPDAASADPDTGATGTESSGADSTESGTGTTGADSTGADSTTATKTYTGDAIATQYGNAQVRVTIAGGKITEVEALQLQANEPKSVQISSSAAPILRESALSKQSGDLDAVSGATVTSASYEASLQSALDQAGFQAADGSRGSSEIPEVEEHHGGGFR